MTQRFLPLLLALLLLAPASPVLAGPLLPKIERYALKSVEKELIALARYAARGKDLEAALEELELGLEVLPESKRLKSELKKLEKKIERASKRKRKAEPTPSLAEKLKAKRAEAHEEIALELAKAAVAAEESAPERYRRYRELVQRRFPTKAALDALDLVYFKDYYTWVSRREAKLLESGGELHEGKQLDAATVANLDRQHSTWSNPWVISDEVHEVRTTVSLRKAKQILAYVGAYRRYFLARFGDVWELKAPKGKLPVIVTETQQDLVEQTRAVAGDVAASQAGQIQGAAYYLQSTGSLNPCFVTYEPKEATGRTFKIERFEQIQIPLAHEVTHQIAFEYSKFDADATRQVHHHFWAVEAIANYMGYHSFDGERWTLKRTRMIPMGQGFIEGPFAHCKNHVESLPSLERFMGLSHEEFMSVENYHVAATLAYFLLEGEQGKYRASFAKLLERIHRVKDKSDLFETCFPGVDRAKMQQEWLRFVRGVQLHG
ncbi:MAG TPA: hypothetical protein DEA08_19855 [Planctomycetes bacterium]|nr:hypothetical protein [Planctomycetota bacterium]